MNDRNKFKFSEKWFEPNIPVWHKLLSDLKPNKIKAMEIGAF
jgi:hypothetical protein